MNCSQNQLNNEANNLYVMYNELCAWSYNKKDYKNTLKYFYKIVKYFDIVRDQILNKPNHTDAELNGLQKHFSNIKSFAINASKELGQKKFEDKIETELDKYEKFFCQQKNLEDAYIKVSEQLISAEAYISASNFLKKALQLNPDNYENYRALGDCYKKTKEREKAIACYLKYDEHCPNNPLVYNSLGVLYSIIDKYGSVKTQIEFFKKAITILPNFAEATRNLAVAYRHADMDEEAMKYYTKLIKMDPTDENFFNYGCEKIKFGDFEEGWKYFEHRFKREANPVYYPEIKRPKWNGIKDLRDKILFVRYEQGIGDSINFFRYLPQIKAKKIIFMVQDNLFDLFKINSKGIEIVKKSTPIEDLKFDYHIPLMSLLHLLKARIDNIPLPEGFLKADEEKVKKYKKEFFDNDCFKIGITWHGANWGNEVRDVPLEYLYPLARLKNVKVYSFQKEVGEELSQLPPDVEIINLGEKFNDFSDTAAAMENLDLFVTSDNGVCNLAGAMGKRTFLLLNRDCEWRWFFDEEKTPWFNSVRIFKKEYELQSWDELVKRVIEVINKDLT